MFLILVLSGSHGAHDYPVPAGYADSARTDGAGVQAIGDRQGRSAHDGEGYAEGGDRACMMCHQHDDDPPITGIFHTVHALEAVPGTPAAGMGCQSCHGPSETHLRRDEDGRRPPPAVSFSPDEPASVKNQACLACHDDSDQRDWHGSAHEFSEISCVGCHTSHEADDPVVMRETRDTVCMDCHTDIRASLHRPASHPVLEGGMSCMDCHDPHGSAVEGDLLAGSVNESCYTCHAEFRGPFVWEHDPVRESCLNCHDAHGSPHRGMLQRRGPQMCQECHSAAFHPSTARSGEDIPPTGASSSMLQRNCVNCHTEVHGSNHPSGAGQTR